MEENRKTPGRRQHDKDLEDQFAQCPKFSEHELTDAQIDEIAERAAKKAVELAKNEMYTGVGKRVVNGIFYIIGAVSIGIFAVGVHFGWIKV